MKTGWGEISVSKLVFASWNYKKDDESTVDMEAKLVANIKKNGVIENVLVRPTGGGMFEVVNGNHRLKVMRTLGIKKVMAYNLGNITLAQAQRIALETNETRFPADDVKMASILQTILGEFSVGDLVSTFPKTEEEVAQLSRLLDFDFEKLPDDKGDGGEGGESKPGGLTDELVIRFPDVASYQGCMDALRTFGMTGPWDAVAALKVALDTALEATKAAQEPV